MNAVAQDNSILFPPGRIVQGDLYEPQDKDMQGNPLITKQGTNQGKPRVNYFFAIAIPKTGERAWWETQWGAKIVALANSFWPQGQTQTPRFAWKVSDGDDATPNPEANMRRNCDREGYPGHWIVRFGSGYATKVYDAGGNPLLQAGLVKRGFWVEVLGNINSNENPQKPGIYVNHQMVFYRAPDKEIVSGPDPRTVGAGRAALPPGVTAQPAGNAANVPANIPGAPPQPGATPAVPGYPPAANVPAVPGAPPAPAAYPNYPGAGAPPAYPGAPGGAPAMPGQVPAVPGAPMPGPTPVQPQAAFLQPPGPGAGAPPPPAAPGGYTPPPPAAVPSVACPLGAPMGYKMVNLNGGRYEAFKAGGWTDATMLQAGHMVRL